MIYDNVGFTYDNTRKADPYIVSRIIYHLNPKSGCKYLDIACGTGNYTIALKESGVDITGYDQSQTMVNIAKSKNSQVSFYVSDVESIAVDDNAFQGGICTLAIHHFNDLNRAFQELSRVISRGRLVIFTCSHEQIRGYWLNEYFKTSIDRMYEYMPDYNCVESALHQSGFNVLYTEPYFVQEDLCDGFLYCKKNHPEAYLDRSFLLGMSVFSLKANNSEIEAGCQKLETDICSGRIKSVMKSYSSYPHGDYMFIVAEK